MKTVLITGGTGFIGNNLSEKLISLGYTVSILSRTKKKSTRITYYLWNIENNEIEDKAILSADFIIHLTGAGIADKKWTPKRKNEIIDSRVNSTKLILKKIKELGVKPKAFISASGINYYGTYTSDHIFTEKDKPSDDFLGKTCQLWEEASDPYKKFGIRTVKLRTGIALAKNGGALKKMSLPIQFGLGVALGSGQQYMPWIHIEDLCNLYIKAIQDSEMNGSYNAVAPEYLTNQEFTRIASKSLKKPFWLPNIPSRLLKLLLGELSDMLLYGSRASADKIISLGFTFIYPTFKSAIEQIVNEK